MVREQIALISDVHGNLTALEAVLADLDERGIERIINLGDLVGKGPRGREVVATCQQRCEITIQGNWDDVIGDRNRVDGDLAWWRHQLEPDQVSWLADLPFCHDLVLSGRRIRLLHASSESVHRRVRFVKTQAEFLGQFANTPATVAAVGDGPTPDVVGYADTHDPFYETERQSLTLFNTGSCGNSMGDPTACYVVLEGEVGSLRPAPFSVAFVRVPYDVEAELVVAEQMGVPHLRGYQAELRHGIYRGLLEEFERSGFEGGSYYHAPPG